MIKKALHNLRLSRTSLPSNMCFLLYFSKPRENKMFAESPFAFQNLYKKDIIERSLYLAAVRTVRKRTRHCKENYK